MNGNSTPWHAHRLQSGMSPPSSPLAGWTDEQIAQGKRWVQAWKAAAPELERIRRDELRRLDPLHAIALLCGPADYSVAPPAPKPTSELCCVRLQEWS
jgi:hypothetical protein